MTSQTLYHKWYLGFTYVEFEYDADDGAELLMEVVPFTTDVVLSAAVDDAPPGLVDGVGADGSGEPGL